MQQNASDLFVLFGAFIAVMSLPILIGIIAVLREKGVTIHPWSPEVLATLKKAWGEVVKEKSAEDPLFKEVAEHYAAFRKEYALWKEHGYLK